MEWLGLVTQQVENLGEGPFRGMVILLAYFLIRELRGMRKSMNSLHVVLTRVVSKLDSHERRIGHLEKGK